jgi:hypothetical protein
MGTRHPWEITLREFVEKARRDYGIQIDPSIFDRILSYRRRDNRVYILPHLEWDADLTPTLLRDLCRLFSLPPEDFHLDPEEED